jgi:hypothetical protein
MNKAVNGFMDFTWDEETIQVPVPLHQMKTLIDSFQQMYRSLEPFFGKSQLQGIFREFLADLETSLGYKLETYGAYNRVSGPRIKEQLDYLLDSLKKLYIKMDLTLENFEINIKELTFSKCQFN